MLFQMPHRATMLGIFELYLIKEAALKGFVHILRKIRRGYKYTLKQFKLLKNYVLY